MVSDWSQFPKQKKRTGAPTSEEMATSKRMHIDVPTLRTLRAEGQVAPEPERPDGEALDRLSKYTGREQKKRPEIPPQFNPFKGMNFGEVLSPEEAGAFRPVLIDCLTQYTDWLDDAITHTNRKGADAEIWSTMTTDEITILADAMLAYGRKHVLGAIATRQIVVSWGYVKIGVIVAPRFFATMRFYAENGFGFPMGEVVRAG